MLQNYNKDNENTRSTYTTKEANHSKNKDSKYIPPKTPEENDINDEEPEKPHLPYTEPYLDILHWLSGSKNLSDLGTKYYQYVPTPVSNIKDTRPSKTSKFITAKDVSPQSHWYTATEHYLELEKLKKDGLLKSARCIRETKTTMTPAETFNYDSQIRHTTIEILGEKEEILIGNTLHSFTTTNTCPAHKSTDWGTSQENPRAQRYPDHAAGSLFRDCCATRNSSAPQIDRIATQAGPWRFYSPADEFQLTEPNTLTYKWVQYALLSHIGLYRTLPHKTECRTCILDFQNKKYQQKIYCINCSNIRNPLSFNDPSLQKIFNFSQEGEGDHLYSNSKKK